jgi:DeoR/GlpR family transcriptional regulator of sugar metabolism
MMEMAERTILVCSHVRFGRETLLRVCGTNAVSLIVTDGNLPEETKEMYEKEGMHIVCGPGGII